MAILEAIAPAAGMDGADRLQMTARVIESHAEWQGIVTRRIFFPERYRTESAETYSALFRDWAAAVAGDEGMDRGSIEILSRLHGELMEAGGRAGRDAGHGHKLDEKTFEAFQELAGEVLARLLRSYHDLSRTESGVDPATGLRNRKRMLAEMRIEMDRRARRGNPFSVVLAHIDNYALLALMPTDERHAVLTRLGEVILKCVRTFDDAYSCGDGEFALSLKLSTTPGGTAAINRLRHMIDDANIVIEDGKGGHEPLTMSYCVSEPLPGETLDTLFANMRADLKRYKGKGGLSLEYAERSPLSRLIGDLN